jgi:hemerythrin-like metal-binding protein
MPFYSWTEAMSVGVAVLDSDHKALINLINGLHQNLVLDEDPAMLDELFERLVHYVDYHFAREERVMETCEYPDTDTHRQEHRKLAQDLRYFRDRHIRGGETKIGQELLNFLKHWLNHHILNEDMLYKKYAEDNPRASVAAESFGPGLSDPNWKNQPHLLSHPHGSW